MTRTNSSSHVAHPAMYRGFARPLLGLLICVNVSGGRLAAEPASDDGRPSLSLDGAWQFRIDPNDEGASAGWFSADVPFPETIRVPGNWQAQGFGEPRNHLSHDYQGKAWYRRTVDIPAYWAGKRVWLHRGERCASLVAGRSLSLSGRGSHPGERSADRCQARSVWNARDRGRQGRNAALEWQALLHPRPR